MRRLPKGKFGAILADPPWDFKTWSELGRDRSPDKHYDTLDVSQIMRLRVPTVAADNCVLFLWATWPMLEAGMDVISAWGFRYKTCAFCWTKADARQLDMFESTLVADMGLGYWTRANAEVCLLATRGNPKRLDAGVRQGIIEPAREHSRKPDCVYDRIERLVAGPYLELYARSVRRGWTQWGADLGQFKAAG